MAVTGMYSHVSFQYKSRSATGRAKSLATARKSGRRGSVTTTTMAKARSSQSSSWGAASNKIQS